MSFLKKWWKNKLNKSSNDVNTSQEVDSDSNLYKFKLSSFSEVVYVSKILLKKEKVLINLNEIEKAERRRILDFLSGVIFFKNGKAKKLKDHIYYFSLKSTF